MNLDSHYGCFQHCTNPALYNIESQYGTKQRCMRKHCISQAIITVVPSHGFVLQIFECCPNQWCTSHLCTKHSLGDSYNSVKVVRGTTVLLKWFKFAIYEFWLVPYSNYLKTCQKERSKLYWLFRIPQKSTSRWSRTLSSKI